MASRHADITITVDASLSACFSGDSTLLYTWSVPSHPSTLNLRNDRDTFGARPHQIDYNLTGWL